MRLPKYPALVKVGKVVLVLYLTVAGTVFAVKQSYRQAAQDQELHEYRSVDLTIKFNAMKNTAHCEGS